MPDCPSFCQSTFDSYSPLKLSVLRSGSDVLVYAQNTGRSIILIKRLLLCLGSPSGTSVVYLREEDFTVGGERVEQSGTWLKYRTTAPGVTTGQAQAEYVEVTERSLSACAAL